MNRCCYCVFIVHFEQIFVHLIVFLLQKDRLRTLRSKTIFGNSKPFKNNEKCSLFHLKSSSFSIYLNFCLDFLVMNKKGLMRKIRLISRLVRSQPGKQTIAMYILSNISRSSGNQTIKFGQLIKCNMRNIFLKKSIHKMCWKTIPRPFSKKSKFTISLDQWSKVL